MMVKIFMDANQGIAGRIASEAVKSALNGDEVFIVNVDKAIISGSVQYLIARYQQRISRGTPHFGPYYPKTTTGIFKRLIRGMVKYKSPRGRAAFKRIKVYAGIPEFLKDNSFKPFYKTKQDLDTKNYISMSRLSTRMGGRR